MFAIVKSFDPGSKSLNIVNLIEWLLRKPPQVQVLETFIFTVLPTLKHDTDDHIWHLESYGAAYGGQILSDFAIFRGESLDIFEMIKIQVLVDSWVRSDFVSITPSQWHSCHEHCHIPCSMKNGSTAMLHKIAHAAITQGKMDLLTKVVRVALLYQDWNLLMDIASKCKFEFPIEVSKLLFFSVPSAFKIYVYDHSCENFKLELHEVLQKPTNSILVSKDKSLTSSELYIVIAQALACCDLPTFKKVRLELGITTFGIIDFISNCNEINYQIISHMMSLSFPSFISKRCHLTDILFAMRNLEFSTQWQKVLIHVLSVSDKKKTALRSEDTITLLSFPFYSRCKKLLTSHTDWSSPPVFRSGSPLLKDYHTLKELEVNQKLALWSTSPRKAIIVVQPNEEIDPRCVFILRKYNLLK